MSETEYDSGEEGSEESEEEQEEPESQEEEKGERGGEEQDEGYQTNSDDLAYQTDPEILDEPYPDDLAMEEYERWHQIIDSYEDPDLEEHWSREGAGTSLASKLEEPGEHNPPPKPDDDVDLAEGYDDRLELEEVISNGVLLYHS